MPGRRANDGEPPVMTWRKATPKLIVCVTFDLLRLIFSFFWLFGPVLLTAAIAGVLSEYMWGWLAGFFAGLAGLAVGIAGSAVFIVLGTILAMMVGLLGWLTIVLWLVMSNPRIFHTTLAQKLWVFLGWGVSELPLFGALPMMTVTVWRMHRRQIHTDRKKHADWVTKKAAAERQIAAEARQIQAMRRSMEQAAQAHQQAQTEMFENMLTPEALERAKHGSHDGEIPAHASLVT